MVVDEEITIFGTVNLDLRSFELNFEVSLIAYDRSVFGSDAGAAAPVRIPVTTSCNCCTMACPAAKWRRLLENAVQVMSPLL
jgi:cardiolipin synthase